jgi:hypothetical protein
MPIKLFSQINVDAVSKYNPWFDCPGLPAAGASRKVGYQLEELPLSKPLL